MKNTNLSETDMGRSEVKNSSCCASNSSDELNNKNVNQEACCPQPTDESSCCDKSESKEVNSEKTGCC